ncbi:MAG: ATP-dependent helicase [Oligosphaeraceae bacterium]
MATQDSPILEQLTDAQREAVTHVDGPLLVVAGAGSGKTRVVTRRIAWLIHQGVWPSQILAMTFTNKAAGEMKERVAALTGEAPANIGTFHSCCARFLRRDLDKLPGERGRDFTIYDTPDQKEVLKRIIARQAKGETKPGDLGAFISFAKNHALSYEEAAAQYPFLCAAPESMVPLAKAYDDDLLHANAMDFDDLLRLAVRLLQEVPGLREVYQSRFRYLLVDEYQDTNHLQYLLMRLLANERQNVHVTGDPDQSIYAWRGADYRNILSFTQDFPQAKVVKLEQNYRSTPNILEAANAVIRCNTDRIEKDLFTQNAAGVTVVDIQTETDLEEADWIQSRIFRLHARKEMPWRSFAVLYRTNAQSRLLEDALVTHGIPYQLLGGLRFYERKEIKDFLALLRFMANPRDFQAFLRILDTFPQGKGLGKRTAELLLSQAEEEGLPLGEYLISERLPLRQKGRSAKAEKIRQLGLWLRAILTIPHSPVAATLEQVEKATRFLELVGVDYDKDNIYTRQENVRSLLMKGEMFTRKSPQGTLEEFLQEVALVADVDNKDDTADSVLLMTLHSSKGLEFPCVFIAGMEDGLLPCHHDDDDLEKILPEERRLFYVGLTRAKKAVFLSHARTRLAKGMFVRTLPSPFLQEIPDSLLQKRRYFGGREIPRLDDGDAPLLPRSMKPPLRWRY